MVAYAKDFLDRCERLKEELGGTRLAVRASRQIVKKLEVESLDELRAYREKVGEEEFGNDIKDLRGVGPEVTELIHSRLGPLSVGEREDTIR